jgi:membrane protein
MVALVFLYVIASIFIWGGELNAAIMRWREYGKAQAEMAPAEE